MTGRLVAACLSGMVVLSGAGCAGEGGAEPTVTLRLWGMGREGEVVQELVPAFEAEHPGIRVEVQQIPWSAAHEKLLTAFVGRSTPDVAQLGNTWVAEFAALKALEPLDRWVEDSGEVSAETYFAGIWDTNVLGGVPYGVPWYVDTRVLFYRRDLLEKAGYTEMPATWDRWLEALRSTKEAAGEGNFAIFLPVNEWTQPVILGLQAGSPLLAENATRGAFGQTAFRRAFTFYLDLYNAKLAPSVGNHEIANVYQEFARGHFAMWITGPWNLGEFRRRLPAELADAWGTAPLPGPDASSPGVSLAGGSSLVMFRGSPHKKEAWQLVEYLSRPEVQVRFYELTGDLPGRVEAWRDPVLATDPHLRAFRQQLEHVKPLPKIPEWEQIATRVQERAEAAIRGAVPPDSALALMDRDVARILEKRRWLMERGRLP